MASYIVKFENNSILATSTEAIKDYMSKNDLTVDNITEIVEYTKMFFTKQQFTELLGGNNVNTNR